MRKRYKVINDLRVFQFTAPGSFHKSGMAVIILGDEVGPAFVTRNPQDAEFHEARTIAEAGAGFDRKPEGFYEAVLLEARARQKDAKVRKQVAAGRWAKLSIPVYNVNGSDMWVADEDIFG